MFQMQNHMQRPASRPDARAGGAMNPGKGASARMPGAGLPGVQGMPMQRAPAPVQTGAAAQPMQQRPQGNYISNLARAMAQYTGGGR